MILFVGNLNKLTTETDLKTLFSRFGEIVKSKIMVDKITRRSRGYAYVHMSEAQDAESAVNKLNSSSFMQSWIIVGRASTRQLDLIEWT